MAVWEGEVLRPRMLAFHFYSSADRSYEKGCASRMLAFDSYSDVDGPYESATCEFQCVRIGEQ